VAIYLSLYLQDYRVNGHHSSVEQSIFHATLATKTKTAVITSITAVHDYRKKVIS
jgi:hypothetical protein